MGLLKAAAEQGGQNIYHSSSFTDSGQILRLKRTTGAVLELVGVHIMIILVAGRQALPV